MDEMDIISMLIVSRTIVAGGSSGCAWRLPARCLMSNQQLTVERTQVEAQVVPSLAPVSPVWVEHASVKDGYKRVFDIAIVVAAHLALLPIWILLWTLIPLAIWVSNPGPIFYSQTRLGKNGMPFRVIKFRTMIKDAEKYTGAIWALENDPRVTSVGRFLRKSRLDELPQILNILKGEMSLVGPRPERPELIEEFSRHIPDFNARLRVRPGIAGLAQVRGRYSTDPRCKLRYDNLYIDTLSPWFDLKLLVLDDLLVN